jgi:transcriptional regulator with XRE-family HTH domain
VDIRKTIGDNIRAYRKEIGWSQEKLGVRAKLHSHYISRLELGQENVQIATLEKIAKTLKIDIHLLFVRRA